MSTDRYKWILIGVLWCVCLLNYADRQAVFVLFPELKAEFHLTDLQLALIGSSFMWTYAAFGPAAGWLGDQLSRKVLILAGISVWILAATGTFLSHDYWQLTWLRALSGISEAVYFPAAMSLISHYHGPDTRSRAMSIHQSAVYVGTIAGGVAAPMVAERWGWRASFLWFDCFGACIVLLAGFFLREPRRTPAPIEIRASAPRRTAHNLHRTVSDVLGSPLVLRLVVTFIGANFVAAVFMVWLPSFLYRRFHLSLSTAGIDATFYFQAASVVGVLCGGVMADALARSGKGGRMRAQAIGLFAGAPFLLLTGFSPTARLLVVGMVGFGFCKGIYDSNIWASLHDVVRPAHRASAVGIMNSLGWLGASLAPIAIAWFSKRVGMGTCLSATSLVYLGIAILLLYNASSTVRLSSEDVTLGGTSAGA